MRGGGPEIEMRMLCGCCGLALFNRTTKMPKRTRPTGETVLAENTLGYVVHCIVKNVMIKHVDVA